MPNLCSNTLRVFGPDEDVARFKEQAAGYSPWGHVKDQEHNVLNFHSLAPVPPEILAAGYNDAGYNWERENWGCKWGACESHLVDEWEGHLHYAFDTAWAPPIPFLEKLAPQWPTLKFLLDYEELSMGFKGITADNGTEFHNYPKLESILGTRVYFATPHHAWERGTNENTNGLIRQYLPKGTNLSSITQQQCYRIAEQLNNRPRLRLDFQTPNEVYY